MRKKILFLSAVIISVALFAGIGILIATDVPDEINVKSDAFPKYKKGAVKFTH